MLDPETINSKKIEFKKYLENEFLNFVEASKNYKSELKWFDGVCQDLNQGLGKDKRGVSGVEKEIIIKIGKKNFNPTEKF